MGGKAARTKGHSFERLVAIAFRVLYPDAKRGYQTRGGTEDAPDVDGTPFYVECKKQKSQPSIYGALKQAKEGTDGRPPLAITARDREEPIASMYFKDFLRLIDELRTQSGNK